MKPFKALDLYCGSGSVSIGLKAAGFLFATGVDIKSEAKKWYPYKFVQQDVLALSVDFLKQFDCIWASPPCQAHTSLLKGRAHNHIDLIPETRDLLIVSGRPYVIENTPLAPLRKDLVLCGSMFNLKTIRHRIFECSFPVKAYYTCICQKYRVIRYDEDRLNPNGVYQLAGNNIGSKQDWSNALGEKRILPLQFSSQAIPPIYAQHIGEQAIKYLLSR